MGGSVIDWVMKTRGVSFRNAVELLKADHPSLAAGNGHGGAQGDHSEAGLAGDGGRGRPADPAPGGRLLSPDAEGLAGGAALSSEPRPDASGDAGALPTGLRQPHALLHAGREEPEGRRRDAGAAATARHSAGIRPRAHERLGGGADLLTR